MSSAIIDYDTLKAAVSDYMARSDIAARVPDFIAFAEDDMNRYLADYAMETSASVSVTNGTGTVPTDLEKIRVVNYVGTDTWPLSSVSLDELYRKYDATASDPQVYALNGSSLIVRPIFTGTLSVVYTLRIPDLSDSAPTNWMLTREPGCYLAGALAHAYGYIKDGETAAAWGRRFEQILTAINARHVQRTGAMVMRSTVRAP